MAKFIVLLERKITSLPEKKRVNIRFCSIENEYDCYDKNKLPEFEELALETEVIMQMLVLGLGNGLFVELKIEVFSLDDYDVVKKLYCNVGNSIKVQPNSELKKIYGYMRMGTKYINKERIVTFY